MPLADTIAELLECAEEALDPPVCRVFQNPGENAPHDVCEKSADGSSDGQLWVAHTATAQGWPAPSSDPVTCATIWSETVELGVVRCAESKIRDDGTPPSEDSVTADAQRQEDDRLALRNAFLCCAGIEGKDLIVEGWEPIEPLGGCVGGIWTIIVRDSGCDCSSFDSV